MDTGNRLKADEVENLDIYTPKMVMDKQKQSETIFFQLFREIFF